MQSSAPTVEQYLKELPAERRMAIETIRKVILDNLPEGYEEAMNWGMITYQVPLSTYPDTYNDKPLMYAALASQKNHMAVYLNNIYVDEETAEWFTKAYKDTGKKLDMGKSCVRFEKLENLPLELIGEAIALTPLDEFIKRYEASRQK